MFCFVLYQRKAFCAGFPMALMPGFDEIDKSLKIVKFVGDDYTDRVL